MKGKVRRLEGKLGSKDIMEALKISSSTFRRWLKKGILGNVKQDPISKDYYINPEDLSKIQRMITNNS